MGERTSEGMSERTSDPIGHPWDNPEPFV